MAVSYPFSNEKVFKEASINTVCDKLLTIAEKNGKRGEFVLSGIAAKIIQGEQAEPVKSIVFIVENKKIFDAFQELRQTLKNSAFKVSYENAIRFKVNAFPFEIYYTENTIQSSTVNGVSVQDKGTIPPELTNYQKQ